MKKRIKIILFLCFIAQIGFSQDRYLVFFTDKNNSPYSLDRPEEFLGPRALERRQDDGISLDESDLPVNPAYVNTVKSLGIETYFTTKWMNGVIVQMESSDITAIEGLSFVERVEYVAASTLLSHEPNESPVHLPISNETVSNATDDQLGMLGANRMHEEGLFGEGVLIGVFDAGFENYTRIPAFQGLVDENRVLYTKDYSTNANQVQNESSHGTRVLSVLAGKTADFQGISTDATYILAITEAPEEYRVEEYNWVFAAEQADSAGVDIIQTSLGYSYFFTDESMNYTPADMDGQTAVVSRAAKIASDKGILVVKSAGNLGRTPWRIVSAPGDVEEVLTVGAAERAGFRSSFSSIGPTADGRIKPDVMALGGSTALIASNGQTIFQSGTSFSAPLISGFAANLMQNYPGQTAAEIRQIIKLSGNLSNEPNSEFGYGIPGYRKVKEVISPLNLSTGEVRIFPNPVSQQNYVTLAMDEGFLNSPVQITVSDMTGLVHNQLNFNAGLLSNRLELTLGNMKSGMYLIRIAVNGQRITKRLMIN